MADKRILGPDFGMHELVTLDDTPPPFGLPGIKVEPSSSPEWDFISGGSPSISGGLG